MVEIVVWEKERCVVVKADVVKSNSALAQVRNPGLDLRRGCGEGSVPLLQTRSPWVYSSRTRPTTRVDSPKIAHALLIGILPVCWTQRYTPVRRTLASYLDSTLVCVRKGWLAWFGEKETYPK